jgi:hypothetical protein
LQIHNAIVRSYAVFVVCFWLREFTVNIEPSKSVRKIANPVKLNSDVPIPIKAAGNVSFFDAPGANLPNEYACFRRVIQRSQQPLVCEFHVRSSKQQSGRGVGKRRIKPPFGDQPSQRFALYGKESTIGLEDRIKHINHALAVLT